MPRHKKYDHDIVLNRAMHVFWKNGYEATSVRMLEKEMGINQFSIYSSFSSKKSLFIESIRKYRDHVKQNVFYSLMKENAGLAELEAFLKHSVKSGSIDDSSKGCLVVNTAAELGGKDKEITREINLYFDFIRDMLKKVFDNAVGKGELPSNTDTEQYACFYLFIMQGLSVASKTMDKEQISLLVSNTFRNLK